MKKILDGDRQKNVKCKLQTSVVAIQHQNSRSQPQPSIHGAKKNHNDYVLLLRTELQGISVPMIQSYL